MKKTYFAPTTTIYNVKAQAILQTGSPQTMESNATENGGPDDGNGHGYAAFYEELEDY